MRLSLIRGKAAIPIAESDATPLTNRIALTIPGGSITCSKLPKFDRM
jgi:hypothetical protein